jgi:hypothetical protein
VITGDGEAEKEPDEDDEADERKADGEESEFERVSFLFMGTAGVNESGIEAALCGLDVMEEEGRDLPLFDSSQLRRPACTHTQEER